MACNKFGHICQLIVGQHTIHAWTTRRTQYYTPTHSSFQQGIGPQKGGLRPTVLAERGNLSIPPSFSLPLSSKIPERGWRKEWKGKQQAQGFHEIYREPKHKTMSFLSLIPLHIFLGFTLVLIGEKCIDSLWWIN